MKTRRCGSRSSCPSNQSSRRFRISARSCSLAWADFFECQSTAIQERPQRRPTGAHAMFSLELLQQFADRRIRCSCDQPEKIIAIWLELGTARLALLARRAFARRTGPANPDDRCGLADPKASCRLPCRTARQRRVNYTITQILAVSSRHPSLPLLEQPRTRIVRVICESCSESEISERALGHIPINGIPREAAF